MRRPRLAHPRPLLLPCRSRIPRCSPRPFAGGRSSLPQPNPRRHDPPEGLPAEHHHSVRNPLLNPVVREPGHSSLQQARPALQGCPDVALQDEGVAGERSDAQPTPRRGLHMVVGPRPLLVGENAVYGGHPSGKRVVLFPSDGGEVRHLVAQDVYQARADDFSLPVPAGGVVAGDPRVERGELRPGSRPLSRAVQGAEHLLAVVDGLLHHPRRKRRG